MRRPTTPISFALLGAIMVAGLAGCRGYRFLEPPGPMLEQQANAVVHDPFPQDDIAPSDPSARPPDYLNSVPEPVRNRIYAKQVGR